MPNLNVSVQNIVNHCSSFTALNAASLNVAPGKVAAINGASGSDKSPFLRCINHLDPSDEGNIFVGGHLMGWRNRSPAPRRLSDRNIRRPRAEIGMVFQKFNLFLHFTVLRMRQILATHDTDFARVAADGGVFLDNGKIAETGLPENLLRAPDHPRMQAFLKRLLRKRLYD